MKLISLYNKVSKKISYISIPRLGAVTGPVLADRKVLYRAFYILALGIFVWFSNIMTVQANQGQLLVWLDEESTVGVTQSVSSYTPLIDENTQKLQKMVKGEKEGFLVKPEIGEEVNQEYQYTVQQGDTITTIAEKFKISVASIQEINGLSSLDLEKIKPGQILTIPPYNTTDSLAWLNDINTEKARVAAEEAKKREAAAAAERARLARLKRTVAYRDQSSGREAASEGYDGGSAGGPPAGGLVIPINHNGITRGITSSHTGIDLRANVGTPVKASQQGKVIETTGGWGSGWGLSVVIDHGGGLTTRYAHLSKISAGVGTFVSQGEIIGYSGNTGWSTGPHLHWEARQNGRIVNPLSQ